MLMLWVQRLWLRLQALFSRRRVAEQLDDEIQFHLDQQISEYVAAGMDREEARHAAMRSFGNRTLLKEKTMETWGWGTLDQLGQDLRYAFRGMRRDVGSTVLAILIAGFGIGGASTVFSVVNALLLRPLPFRDPGRLVWISNEENYSTQAEHYSDLREENQSFTVWPLERAKGSCSERFF
jgi:macrolide transport system ATP-binding/permease protein